MKHLKYPCAYCESRQQGGCDGKGCPLWRRWFIHRWERTRSVWVRL